ncbi:MAG: hypothetical protein RLZZ417_998 [Bacteroidota bacterium]|jgi:hypothetical protein
MNENSAPLNPERHRSTIFAKVWPRRPHAMQMDKFSLILTGITLSIEVPEIIGLKNFYDND